MRGFHGGRRVLVAALAIPILLALRTGAARAEPGPTFAEQDLSDGSSSTAATVPAPSEEGWDASPPPPVDETGAHATRSTTDGGAAGKVKDGLDEAGRKTGAGIEEAGAATGRVIDKAITKTGEGVGYVVDKTGEGLRKAGEALSGEGK